MSDDKKAISDAVAHMAARQFAHQERMAWVYASACQHTRTMKVMGEDFTRETCDDCGASRTEFIIPPTMRTLGELLEQVKAEKK